MYVRASASVAKARSLASRLTNHVDADARVQHTPMHSVNMSAAGSKENTLEVVSRYLSARSDSVPNTSTCRMWSLNVSAVRLGPNMLCPSSLSSGRRFSFRLRVCTRTHMHAHTHSAVASNSWPWFNARLVRQLQEPARTVSAAPFSRPCSLQSPPPRLGLRKQDRHLSQPQRSHLHPAWSSTTSRTLHNEQVISIHTQLPTQPSAGGRHAAQRRQHGGTREGAGLPPSKLISPSPSLSKSLRASSIASSAMPGES
jgi:hypothetical protein